LELGFHRPRFEDERLRVRQPDAGTTPAGALKQGWVLRMQHEDQGLALDALAQRLARARP